MKMLTIASLLMSGILRDILVKFIAAASTLGFSFEVGNSTEQNSDVL